MLMLREEVMSFFFFQAEDGIRDYKVTGVQTCALPISAFAQTTAAESASDKKLDSQIESRIHKDDSLKRYDIDVRVNAGVATLTGTVEIGRASCRERV